MKKILLVTLLSVCSFALSDDVKVMDQTCGFVASTIYHMRNVRSKHVEIFAGIVQDAQSGNRSAVVQTLKFQVPNIEDAFQDYAYDLLFLGQQPIDSNIMLDLKKIGRDVHLKNVQDEVVIDSFDARDYLNYDKPSQAKQIVPFDFYKDLVNEMEFLARRLDEIQAKVCRQNIKR